MKNGFHTHLFQCSPVLNETTPNERIIYCAQCVVYTYARLNGKTLARSQRTILQTQKGINKIANGSEANKSEVKEREKAMAKLPTSLKHSQCTHTRCRNNASVMLNTVTESTLQQTGDFQQQEIHI